MKKHQRYFPVYEPGGALLPYFVAVRNGDSKHLDLVRDGNEHVIRARFSDASFFYRNDIKRPLESYLVDLKQLTFQYELGSMYDRVRRLEQLASQLAETLDLNAAERGIVRRAATLSKADLATSLVIEMTSLQGIMGAHYARRSGEKEGVALALAEQYEAVASTGPGLALGLADRLDRLVGLFAVGLAPKGSNDPFALRRAAIHIIENLIANKVSLDLRPALQAAAELLPLDAPQKVLDEVLAFIAARLEVYLQESGIQTNVVKAVLARQSHNPYSAYQAAQDLNTLVELDGWPQLLDALARCVRITRSLDKAYQIRPDDYELPEENALLAEFQEAAAMQDGSVRSFARGLRQLEPAITRFFDEVLVMDEDAAKRENRLALLQAIANLPADIADLSELEGF
jgi:glycyl-tRNA synthetase